MEKSNLPYIGKGLCKMKLAICPGSFDPVTYGHLDIINRAAKMFDRVIVVVMENPRKAKSVFSAAERVEMLLRCTKNLSNVVVDVHDGLLASYAGEKGAVAIVKGLRAVSDFEYEFQQALANKQLNPQVETVFVATSAQNMFLTSSVVKEVCYFGGDVSAFVPPEILEDIVERLSR
jgi:pantetheine-phosphate adenylyltransferase